MPFVRDGGFQRCRAFGLLVLYGSIPGSSAVLFRGKDISVKERDEQLRETEKVKLSYLRNARRADREAFLKEEARQRSKQAKIRAEEERLQVVEAKARAEAEIEAADAAATEQRIKESLKARSSLKPFANQRNAAVSRDIPLFRIFSVGAKNFCFTVTKPHVDGAPVVLTPCYDTDIDDAELFWFDPSSDMIHPNGTDTICVDFESDADKAALTTFTCDKSTRNFQKWHFNNGSSIINSKSLKCLQKSVLRLEQQDCLQEDSFFRKDQLFRWIPLKEYAALTNGRLWSW